MWPAEPASRCARSEAIPREGCLAALCTLDGEVMLLVSTSQQSWRDGPRQAVDARPLSRKITRLSVWTRVLSRHGFAGAVTEGRDSADAESRDTSPRARQPQESAPEEGNGTSVHPFLG